MSVTSSAPSSVDPSTPKSPPREAGAILASDLIDKFERRAGVTQKYMPLYRRSLLGTASPRSAIKAMCQYCVGYQDAMKAVAECSARQCPLWSLRPYQPKGVAR